MSAKSERGFSLIELVVAMAFMGVVILALFELFVQLRQVNRTANNYTIATQIAQQIVERYRNTPYANIPTGVTDYSPYLTSYPELKSPRSASATITQVDPDGLKQVDVAISYKDRTGTKNVQFTTLISNIGINR